MPQLPDLDGLIAFYHELTPTSIARFPEFYREDAEFKDPFNDVRGVAAIRFTFAHMFTQADAPRFVVSGRVDAGGGADLDLPISRALGTGRRDTGYPWCFASGVRRRRAYRSSP